MFDLFVEINTSAVRRFPDANCGHPRAPAQDKSRHQAKNDFHQSSSAKWLGCVEGIISSSLGGSILSTAENAAGKMKTLVQLAHE
jgi:hypothetical protein